MANFQLPAELMQALLEKFPNIEVQENQMVIVSADDLIPFMSEVKENPDYALDLLTNLTAAEYNDHFETVYNLISITNGFDLMVKVKLTDKDNPSVPSLCPLWGGANWQERETYDLMGINFTDYPGHPTRILLLDTFNGHPLRKDFKWEGGRE
ncbi:NADH-quinone oxidoreductase subunit C [Desulfocucumis palustris]|nr:NADH-quinone oxidoreductase subunit C [Desulfocucumis palustris]